MKRRKFPAVIRLAKEDARMTGQNPLRKNLDKWTAKNKGTSTFTSKGLATMTRISKRL